MIYLDNAATTLRKPEGVKTAMIRALEEAGNPGRGAYAASLNASRILFRASEAAAELLGTEDPERIAFTQNVTESLNAAVSALPEMVRKKEPFRIITTRTEHNSVLRPLYRLEKEGKASLTFWEPEPDGRLDPARLPQLLTAETAAMVITHASNVTGRITDLTAAAAFARENGILLIVDGAQALGAVPVNVERDGIDIYCFTGHKGLYGPQGTGGIYVRAGLAVRPLLIGGSGIHSFDRDMPRDMPTVLEAGTRNTPGLAGLEAGIRFVLETGPERILKHERTLAGCFVRRIREIPNLKLYGYRDMEGTGIVSLNLGEEDAAVIADRLWEEAGICVRAGAHCAPLMHEFFGTKEQGIVRFSFSAFNTEKEAEQAADALQRIAETL
ncbi:aminotransferase class V-fold PLP-dependent enzyme [[Clostridium] aminophilum]|uniref:aminotransferase class V-fold PLP-dependent enzyme n=1 Tax=[Clostridium] aminophilum TaxID=1526 RepID=UPI0033172587